LTAFICTGSVDGLAVGNSDIFSPTGFSPDGTSLLAYGGQAGSGGSDDIWLVHLDDGGRVEPLLDTSFSESTPALSPDGQWLAYTSNESGREEIYVRPFPDVDGGRWQISFGGGIQPHWATSGQELFYRNGDALVSVPVQTDGGFERGDAEALFEDQYFLGRGARAYDVAADGQQFLMVKGAGDTFADERIIIVENWFTALERLVPTQ
jgi:dipeptidyl aminopeptidase/acylaminoacyl peptidase